MFLLTFSCSPASLTPAMTAGRRGLGLAFVMLAAPLQPPTTGPFVPRDTITVLPIASFGAVAVDGANERLFISGGTGTSSIVVTDFDGQLVATIPDEPGATGLVVDGSTLYAALKDVNAVSAIDTATFAETARFPTTPALQCPDALAKAGGRLWFGSSCDSPWGLGALDPATGEVQTYAVGPGSNPILATAAGDPNLLLAAARDTYYSVYGFDVSTQTPTQIAYFFQSSGEAYNTHDVAVTPDAAAVVTASGLPYYLQAFTFPDFLRNGTYDTGSYPQAVDISSDGAYVAGANDGAFEDVFVFEASSSDPLNSFDVVSKPGRFVYARGLAFTPDVSKLFVVTGGADDVVLLHLLDDPTLAPSSLTLSAFPSRFPLGNLVTLTGALAFPTGGDPSDKVIRITRTAPDGGTLELQTTTQDDGAYTAEDVPPTKGTYTYQAFWDGDETHRGSRSQTRKVIVDPAPDASVSVVDFAYTPPSISIHQGDTVQWDFAGPSDHTVTDASGLALFDSQPKPEGSSYWFTFIGAGSYPYQCMIHPFMKGRVSVPLVASPPNGGIDTRFTIRWASEAPPSGFVFDVEIRRPGSSSFETWRSNQTGRQGAFVPDGGVGTYSFRAHLRNTGTGGASAWSPIASIMVS